jgi:MraZ protein
MFYGQFNHTIDAKGRVSFPARFREQLEAMGESRLLVTKSVLHDCCLHIYTPKSWQGVLEKLSKENRFDPFVAKFARMYVAPVMDLDIDAAGRVHLNPDFRMHAHLERDVVWSAGMGLIELWSKAEFDQANQIIPGDFPEFAAKVQELFRT